MGCCLVVGDLQPAVLVTGYLRRFLQADKPTVHRRLCFVDASVYSVRLLLLRGPLPYLRRHGRIGVLFLVVFLSAFLFFPICINVIFF